MESANFRKIITSLPPVLRNTVYSDDTYTNIKDATNLAKLNQDESAILTDIVINILTGMAPLNNFNEELKKQLDISNAHLEIVSKIIQQKIFSSIRHNLTLLPINKHPLIILPETEKITPSPMKPVNVPQKNVSPSPLKIPSRGRPLPPVEKFNIPHHKRPKTESIPKPSPIKKEEVRSIPPKEHVSSHVPEPAEVSVKKPEIRTQELKNFSVPTMPQEQQEKIKNKLLSAMQRRTTPPKVVETMKQLTKEGWKKVKQAVPKKKRPSVYF